MEGCLKRLDVLKTKVNTSYCISDERRDQQMRLANARISGRVQPATQVYDEEIAIVCYGPSLRKTWRTVKNFKKIMTCSGAHKFLLERGITPTWHIDLDPREHKTKMLGEPHKEVEYLMASCCHSSMFDRLEGFNVKLWHIYANETDKELPRTYPRGDWILTGGNNVGMRCLVMARLLGYRNFNIFGMDCSFPQHGSHHADVHLNPSARIYETPYDGKMYYCEPVMLDYARNFFHEVEQLPDVTIKMHGEGLLQHMVYKKMGDQIKVKPKAVIAFSTPVTITPEYVELNKKMHLNPIYGIGGRARKEVVLKLSEALNTRSILDYGCGKGTLAASLSFPIWEYDPAIPGKDSVPRAADLVVCLDVLEHIEPEMLDNVLGDLVRCSNKMLFAIIDTGPADKDLPDGRNAHLIQGDKDWWQEKLAKYFKIGAILQTGSELHCVLEPKKMGPL